MRRPPPTPHRPAYTLLEVMVVLVLLGLSAALVLPALRLPAPAAPEPPLARARALAVRRGEALRLTWTPTGDWSVVAAADTAGEVLLTGAGVDTTSDRTGPAVLITALGTCYPLGTPASGAPAWDPVRCAVTPP